VVASGDAGVAQIAAVAENQTAADLFEAHEPPAGTPDEQVLDHQVVDNAGGS
jgi:hypothetical protein